MDFSVIMRFFFTFLYNSSIDLTLCMSANIAEFFTQF